ncbi:DUF3108 domain-containing protein [Massilia endophytica]|uniref:DUF3108 domain-containing protein n=1 Tax=Massilia endophytica TaxID=2899220 RepID=UPI001E314BB4|nr:DUF3108 domain-containing protein [Massilia endophytica]UGQ46867.1 DUF3108 domain-containing protein [Massilia endophytica]
MAMVPSSFRARRILALGAITVALHYATIDWLAGRIGVQQAEQHPLPVAAQIRMTQPAPPAPAAPPAPVPEKRAAAPKPKPVRKAAPPPAPAPEPAEGDTGSAALAAGAPEGTPGAEAAAAESSAPAEPAPQEQAGAAPAAPPVKSAQPNAAEPGPDGVRRFNVNLPPSAAFELEVKRKDADGTNWTGVADMRWETDGSRYKVGLEVGISMLITRISLLTLNSEGIVDDNGIAPLTMMEKRRSRSATRTHFNQDEKRITFSASTASAQLLPGAQDKATVPFQLAAIGRADVNQFAGDIDIQVGEDRNAAIYRFQLVGEEEIETKMGKLVTMRLARPPRPGSYNARLDIWLAPGLDWYPVQIRNTEGSGAVTTQTVTKIVAAPQ